MTRAFEIRLQLFVLSFCQFSRDSLSTLGIEENHILAVDLFALLWCRIRARNVEIPVLHEVEISIAAACFSPTRKPRVAVRHRSNALVIRWWFGLDLLGAFFKISGKLRRRPTKTQPRHDERQQSQRKGYKKAVFGAAARESVHARDPPTVRSLRATNADFCGQAGRRCSNTATVSCKLFIEANSALIEDQSLNRVLSLPTKGSDHEVSKDDCNRGVSCRDRLFNICIWLGRPCATRFLSVTCVILVQWGGVGGSNVRPLL